MACTSELLKVTVPPLLVIAASPSRVIPGLTVRSVPPGRFGSEPGGDVEPFTPMAPISEFDI